MKRTYQIRRARQQDIERIYQLNEALFKLENRVYRQDLNMRWTRSSYGKAYFRGRMNSRNGCIFVAIYKEKIIGYLSGGKKETPHYLVRGNHAELDNMFVEARHRSKGIGKLLISEFLAWCKKSRMHHISVRASAANRGALRLYRHTEFQDNSITLYFRK